MKEKSYFISVLCGLGCLWLLIITNDWFQVVIKHEKPIFAWPITTSVDEELEEYQEIGYEIKFEKDNLLEGESSQISRYQFSLLGVFSKEGQWDED
ncbi:MAG: hypothetical protein Q4Q00_03625 [Turicibacter sp.]|nr:hypothetical protein [Turicibacter sp.]